MKRFIVLNLDPQAHSFKKERKKLATIGARLIEIKNAREISKILNRVDVLIFTSTSINSDLISKLKRCRLIIRCGTGLDNIDIKAATQQGIMVSRVVNFCTEELSNHTLMLILACSRRLKQFTHMLISGRVLKSFSPMGSIDGETLGLVGFGNIAKAVARKAKCLGMKVITYDPFVKKDVFKKFDVKKSSLEKLLKESDYVSLHCPLTEKTRHLIGRNELRLMKKTAYIINTARGALIDENSLIEALQKKLIAGAGLDVFEKEPPDPENPLLHMENVICTPHYGYYSDRAITRMKQIVIHEITRVLTGRLPENLFNPELLSKKDNA